MNTFTQARAEIAAALNGIDLDVHEYMPERMSPPCALLTTGSPWVEDGEQFGSFTVRYQVTIVAGTATNEVVTDRLDEHMAAAIVALDEADFGIARVDEPYGLQANNATYVAANISLVLAGQINT